MGEDAQAAVLGLDRVVAHPDAGRVVRHVGRGVLPAVGAGLDAGQAAGAARLEVGVPAVAPDGVGAVDRVARGLVATGVHDLEVVDEAVGLLVVAVGVDVVAVLHVEALEVGGDLGHRLARLQLLVDPDRQRVAHQRLGAVADHVATEVAAVGGLVEGDLHPLGDVTLDGVAARGLGLVVLRHAVEVHVLVVALVVVGLPERGVVLGAVRLGDLVVQRAVVPLGERLGGGRAGELRVLLLAELGQHHEDAVGALELERHVLVAALAGHLLALDLALERGLLLRVALGLDLQGVLRGVVTAAGGGRALGAVLRRVQRVPGRLWRGLRSAGRPRPAEQLLRGSWCVGSRCLFPVRR